MKQINKKDAATEEREYCKVVLAWTIVGLILGLVINMALPHTTSLASIEFVVAGIFFTSALIIEPILLARRAPF